jgi:hypothetical protein
MAFCDFGGGAVDSFHRSVESSPFARRGVRNEKGAAAGDPFSFLDVLFF